MNHRFRVFGILLISAFISSSFPPLISGSNAATIISEDDKPTIEINFDALDKFAPSAPVKPFAEKPAKELKAEPAKKLKKAESKQFKAPAKIEAKEPAKQEFQEKPAIEKKPEEKPLKKAEKPETSPKKAIKDGKITSDSKFKAAPELPTETKENAPQIDLPVPPQKKDVEAAKPAPAPSPVELPKPEKAQEETKAVEPALPAPDTAAKPGIAPAPVELKKAAQEPKSAEPALPPSPSTLAQPKNMATSPTELPKPGKAGEEKPAPAPVELPKPALTTEETKIAPLPTELPKPDKAPEQKLPSAEILKKGGSAEAPAAAPSLPTPPAGNAGNKVELPNLPPPPNPTSEMAAALNEPVSKTQPAPAEKVPEQKPEEKASSKLPELPKADATAEPAENKGTLGLSINFTSTETAVPLSSEGDLKKLVEKNKSGNDRIKLIAYASGSGDKATTARRVALSRALAVRAYLIENGIDKLRINVQAEGDKSTSGSPDRVDIFLDEGKK